VHWVREVYIPAKDILGIKIDSSIRYFSKPAILEAAGKSISRCTAVPLAAPANPTSPPSTPAGSAKEPTANLDNSRELFAHDEFRLSAEGKVALEKFAQELVKKNATGALIKILGHADQTGSPYHNLQLSQLRAIAVANFLQTSLKDLDVSIDFQGVGDSRLKLDDNKCPGKNIEQQRISCLGPNRRVEVSATWQGKKSLVKP
jgi:outer membrane protein OmpA-like peptidoglycan-associated protein